MLSLCLHPPPQNEVNSDSEDDEKHTQDDEVDVELGVLDVHLFEDVGRLLENAHALVTAEVTAVETVDRLEDALEGISETEREREMFDLTTHSTHFIYGYMA